MATINRKDLKHDKFVEEVGREIEYFTEHRNTILIAAAAVIVLIVGGGWFYNQQKTIAVNSMAALQDAAIKFGRPVMVDPEPGVQAFVTSGERIREVTDSLEKVKTEFAGTEAAAAADYYSALLDVEKEDLPAAKLKLQSAISGANKEYAALARFALAGVFAAEDDIAAARQEYERLVASPTTAVPAVRSKLALGRLLVKSDPAAARPLLQELADSEGPAGVAAAEELSKIPQS